MSSPWSERLYHNEMSAYFPYNEINPSNQSGFVQVSMYFEVERLQVVGFIIELHTFRHLLI